MDTLVLNADGSPLSLLPLSAISWKEAILYLYLDKCDVLEWYDDWIVHSASWETRVPAVIMLKTYMRKKSSVRFSKYNLLLRDEFRCQYCQKEVNSVTATLDHVIPASQGGKTTWENIVTACAPCNTRKDNKTHMKPQYQPYKPGYYELIRKRKMLPIHLKHDSWTRWLGLEET